MGNRIATWAILIWTGLMAVGTFAAFLGIGQDGTGLAGSELSLADLFPAPVLFYFGMTPEGRSTLPEHAALGRWYGRISGRESFRATVPELPS